MLANLQIETETIKFRGGEFTVRGLGLDTVSALMAQGNRKELDVVVEQMDVLFHSTQAKDSEATTAGLSKLMVQMPSLTAKIIAYAANEPDQVDKVMKLPVSVQLEAILAIGRLTFDGEDSIKNFVSGLVTLMSSMGKAAKQAGQIALNGTQA